MLENLNLFKKYIKIRSVKSLFRLHISLLTILIVNFIIFATVLCKTKNLYVIPYRDMLIGYYPPDKFTEFMLIPWWPENFGTTSLITPTMLIMILLERLFPPKVAFVTYNMLPYFVVSLVAYFAIIYNLKIRDKFTTVMLVLVYAYNWFTFYVFGSTYVLYTYGGGLLILTSLFRLANRDNSNNLAWDKTLILGFILASFGWNLIGLVLVLYLLLPVTIMVLVFYHDVNKLKSLVKLVAISFCSAIIIILPFYYPIFIDVLSKGLVGYASSKSYIVPTSWLSLLQPSYFSMYIGSILKLFSIFTDPFNGNKITSLAFNLFFIILISFPILYKNNIKTHLYYFYLSNLIYILLIFYIIYLIKQGSIIIEFIYNNLFLFVSVLRTVTNFMVILLPSIFFIYLFAFSHVKNRLLRYLFSFLLLYLAFSSNDYFILQLLQIDQTSTLKNAGSTYYVTAIPESVIGLFYRINNLKNVTYNAIWLPVREEDRSAFVSVSGDLPFSGSSFSPVANYSRLLFSYIVNNDSDTTLFYKLLRFFNVKYLVLLKLRNDSNLPKITYFGPRVTGVDGNYSYIKSKLTRIPFLSIIDDTRYYTIYQFNASVSPFILFSTNKTSEETIQIIDLRKNQIKPVNFSYTFSKFHIFIDATSFNQSFIVYSPYSFDEEWWSFKIFGCSNFKINVSEIGTVIYLYHPYSNVISINLELKFIHLLLRAILYLISLIVLICVAIKK